MNSLWKQRILLNGMARCLRHRPKKFNIIGLISGRASYSNSDSLCPPPPSNNSQTPCPPKELPPCPPPPPPCGPPCPPKPCVMVPDPNDPCNYVKPEDPDELDLTKLKKLQCHYQEENEIPMYLRGGKRDVYFFQAVVFMGLICTIQTIYAIYEMIDYYK